MISAPLSLENAVEIDLAVNVYSLKKFIPYEMLIIDLKNLKDLVSSSSFLYA